MGKQRRTAADRTAEQCTNQSHGYHGLTAYAALLFLRRLRTAHVIAGHGIGGRNRASAVVRILGLIVTGLIAGGVLRLLIGNAVAVGLILLIGCRILSGCVILRCGLRLCGGRLFHSRLRCCGLCSRLAVLYRVAGVMIISGCIGTLLPAGLLGIGMNDLIVVVFIAHNGTLLFASFCLRPYDNLKLCPNYRQTQNDI